jgi:hypothetical protein
MTDQFSAYQGAYCRNCGQSCQPERYQRPREDSEPFGNAYIWDFRSGCCHDQLSEEPVSQQCAVCGATVQINVPDADIAVFETVDGDVMCPCCVEDYKREKGGKT